MKIWSRNGCENPFLRRALPALILVAIFLGMGMMLKPVALATEPLALNYRTISAADLSGSPGTTVWTMQLIVTNNGTVTFQNVTVTAGSLTDPTANYGTVAVGDVPVGGVQTVNGEFQVPDASFGDLTFRLDHS